MTTSLIHAFLQTGEVDGVLTGEQCAEYAVDGIEPAAVVLPSTVDGVSRILSQAHRHGAKVVPYGGGTQMSLGNVPKGVDVVLGLTALDMVIDHRPSDLTATVEAGITLAKAQASFFAAGQFLPLQAPCPDRATVGGILATGFSSYLRLAYGAPRDWLIGIKVVSADGTVTRAGGKVVKNVTGYDMNKLYTGSLGTLGVIVEASFKLAPRPPVSRTVVAVFSSLNRALDAASTLLQGYATPSALALVNDVVKERLGIEGSGYALLALFQGRPEAVEARIVKMRPMADPSILDERRGEEGDGLWQRLADLGWVGNTLPALSMRFHLLPSQAPALIQTLSVVEGPPGAHGLVADLGIGSVRSLWWCPDGPSPSKELLGKLKNAASALGLGWVVERCPLELKRRLDVWGPPPEALDLMRRVKARLDPSGILNPGRFVGGI